MSTAPRSWRTRYPSKLSATAEIPPDQMLLRDAARRATPARPHLVITEHGQCAVVPHVLPGMQRIAVQVEPDEEAT